MPARIFFKYNQVLVRVNYHNQLDQFKPITSLNEPTRLFGFGVYVLIS